MDKLNSKLYAVILFGINVISTLVMLWSLFVPLFKVDLGMIQENISLWDYVFSTEYEKAEFFQLSSTQSSIGYFWNLALYLCGAFCAFGVVISAVELVSNYKKLGKAKVIRDLWDGMIVGLIANGIYMIVACIVIMVYFDADITECFSGQLYTKAHIPMILQAVLFLLAWLVYVQSKNTQNSSEDMNTIELLQRYKQLFDAGAISKEAFELKKAELLYGRPLSAGESNLSDLAKTELLMKYKGLWDSGVITEEEYNVQKEKLLFGEKKI